MNLKRKIKKAVAISLATLTIAVTGVSVYASNNVPVRSARDYYYNFPQSYNSNCICAAGYSQLSASTSRYKEVYYDAYGYNVGVGYYSIYGAYKKYSGTMSNCKTSTVSLTSEVKRGTHRFILRNGTDSGSRRLYEYGYIMTE
ncbi:MAG: hypothetical protein K2I03_01375 [Lachnospiraceae bacterium]|nr:hypothetical protein [Lachnospiraceae bacterium]